VVGRRALAAGLAAAALGLGAAALPSQAPSAAPAAARWAPDVESARAYARQRPGQVSFAVRFGGRAWGLSSRRTAPAASLVKAMLLVAYLRQGRVRSRALRRAERRLLSPMIRRSDDVAATRVRDLVGTGALVRLARSSGMRDFRPSPVWGLSRTSAGDQALLFADLERRLPPRHRAYGLALLAGVVGSQRWGVAREAPPGWRLHFKGGWGSGSGAVDHQSAQLRRGRLRVALSVMTTGSPSHAAGQETLRGVAARLLRGLG